VDVGVDGSRDEHLEHAYNRKWLPSLCKHCTGLEELLLAAGASTFVA
jgi:hypothetical protein